MQDKILITDTFYPDTKTKVLIPKYKVYILPFKTLIFKTQDSTLQDSNLQDSRF